MTTYAVGADEVGVYQKQLASDVVDTVNIARNAEWIEVWTDGAAAVYFTVDGRAPTLGGQNTFELPAGGPVVRDGVGTPTEGDTVVKLVAHGTPKYSVTAGGLGS